MPPLRHPLRFAPRLPARPRGLLTVLALTLLACACRSTSPTPDAPPVPPDLVLTFGSGGGVAGRWSGYGLDASGQVTAWSGRWARDEERPAGRLAPEAVEAVWRDVAGADLPGRMPGEPGNLTAFIEVRAHGDTHRVDWAVGPSAPSDLARLYDRLQTAARTAAAP